MRAVVTGGSGFIGSHVVDHLVNAGFDVVVVDRVAPRRDGVEHADIDIADLDGLVAATAGADAVFHLAAFADVNDVAADPVGAVDANVTSTARVWEACRRNGVPRAVLASTVWVYGASPDEGVLDEGALFDLARAGHLYTATKVSAELIVRSYHALYGQEFTILRYGIPYGPGMRPSLVIPKFVGMAQRGDPITVEGDGSQHRNYVYVGDLAAAHVLALAPEGANEVFNLEGSEQVSIRRLVDTISDRVAATEVAYGPPRDGDYAGATISADKAAAVLGWRPTIDFDEGMSRYLEWQADAVPSPVAPGGPTPAPRPPRDRPLAGVAAGALVLPALVFGSGAAGTDRALGLVAALIAVGTAIGVGRTRRDGPSLLTVVGVLVGIWLLSQSGSSLAAITVAPILGACIGALVGDRWPDRSAAAGGALMLVGVSVVADRSLFWAAASLCLVAAAATGVRSPSLPGRRKWAIAVAGSLATSLVGAGVGASSASGAWFGPVLSHGPRTRGEVAVTITGLPNGAAAARLLTLLDVTHVQATFFESRQDVAAHPSVVRRLASLDQEIDLAAPAMGRSLLAIGYDDELERAGNVFRDTVGRCPRFVRSEGAWHSPLTVRTARRHAMQVVTWDVKVPNASRRSPRRLAAELLDEVRPGSIIDIGITMRSGRGTDAAAVIRPLLAGLRLRHLAPVPLARFATTTHRAC